MNQNTQEYEDYGWDKILIMYISQMVKYTLKIKMGAWNLTAKIVESLDISKKTP